MVTPNDGDDQEIGLHGASESERRAFLADFLVEEFTQVWEQYRHVENEKNQYVNYFYAVTVGFVGFSFALLTIANTTTAAVATSICCVAHVYFWVGLSMHVNIRKFDLVVLHYARAMRLIRGYVYESSDTAVSELITEIGIFTSMRRNLRSRYLRISNEPESDSGGGDLVTSGLIVGLLIVSYLVQCSLLVYTATVVGSFNWQVAVTTVEVCAATIGLVIWFIALRIAEQPSAQ